MDGELMSVLIVGIIFFSLVFFVKVIADNKIRSKLIEKGMLDEKVQYLYSSKYDQHVPSALKWGIVLIGVGLAFLIGQLVPIDYTGEVTVGSMFILAGLGLLIYYFIAKRMVDESDKK